MVVSSATIGMLLWIAASTSSDSLKAEVLRVCSVEYAALIWVLNCDPGSYFRHDRARDPDIGEMSGRGMTCCLITGTAGRICRSPSKIIVTDSRLGCHSSSIEACGLKGRNDVNTKMGCCHVQGGELNWI